MIDKRSEYSVSNYYIRIQKTLELPHWMKAKGRGEKWKTLFILFLFL